MQIILLALSMLLVDDKIADRLWESSKVVDELIQAPDSDIPRDLLKKAECVGVIPGLKKAALGFGGELGRGAVSCKKDAGKGPRGHSLMGAIFSACRESLCEGVVAGMTGCDQIYVCCRYLMM